MSLYQMIQQMSMQYERQMAQVTQLRDAQIELNQKDLEALRNVQRCEVKLNHGK